MRSSPFWGGLIFFYSQPEHCFGHICIPDMSKTANSLYDCRIEAAHGNELIDLSSFKGNVILVVNIATHCGFTPQLKGLQELHRKYSGKGLTIIGCPCNQFGNQTPEGNSEIQQFCERDFHADFIITEKIDVNGENTHPVFQYLKSQKSGFLNDSIKWNFSKFLIDKNGKVINRFGPLSTPKSLEKQISLLLNKE